LTEMGGLGPRTAELLEENGIRSIEDLAEAQVETMVNIPGVGEKSAEALIQRASDFLKDREDAAPEAAEADESQSPEEGLDDAGGESPDGETLFQAQSPQIEGGGPEGEGADEPISSDTEAAEPVPEESGSAEKEA
jgi:transcription termination factor NusA